MIIKNNLLHRTATNRGVNVDKYPLNSYTEYRFDTKIEPLKIATNGCNQGFIIFINY
jgi:hypothetical protein